QVFGRSSSYCFVWRSQVQSFGLGQQPVKADDLQSAFFSFPTQLAPTLRGNISDARRQGERSDFQAIVPQISNQPTHAPTLPSFERFVANGVAHANPSSP